MPQPKTTAIYVIITQALKNKLTIARGYVGVNQQEFIQRAITNEIEKVFSERENCENIIDDVN